MAKVQLLEDELINKIAAGEVVERPASVLKELVENAIDAGATQIEVNLAEGGRSLISVKDNGCGMSRDDATLAVKRHTTSKLSHSDDLFSVATMGFRGEALASISSVSRFTFATREQGSEQGVRLELQEGKLSEASYVGEFGSEVTVSDLFFNVPARLAFMKSAPTEYAYCYEYMSSLALARPDLGFKLVHNDKIVLSTSPDMQNHREDPTFWGEELLRKRALEVFKKEDVDQFLYVSAVDKFGRIEGLISPPGHEKGTAKHVYTFVNRRWVKDKLLRYGVMRGYHSHLLKGKHPFCMVHVTLDPSLVDVNVHPAKAELRFQYGGELQGLIALMIRDGIRGGGWAASDDAAPRNDQARQEAGLASVSSPKQLQTKDKSLALGGGFDDIQTDFSSPTPQQARPISPSFSSGNRYQSASSFSRELFGQVAKASASAQGASIYEKGPASQTVMSFDFETNQSSTVSNAQETIASHKPIDWSSLTFIGTYARCYLLFEAQGALLAVDQHAFHERIIYERLKTDKNLLTDSQALLMPEYIELSATERQALKDSAEDLQAIGFRFNFIGNEAVELLALPSILTKADPEALISELLKAHCASEHEDTSLHLTHDILATLACHSAVRAGEMLDTDDLNELLRQADGVDFYLNCPHGRRVFKWWRLPEIERWFDR